MEKILWCDVVWRAWEVYDILYGITNHTHLIKSVNNISIDNRDVVPPVYPSPCNRGIHSQCRPHYIIISPRNLGSNFRFGNKGGEHQECETHKANGRSVQSRVWENSERSLQWCLSVSANALTYRYLSCAREVKLYIIWISGMNLWYLNKSLVISLYTKMQRVNQGVQDHPAQFPFTQHPLQTRSPLQRFPSRFVRHLRTPWL